MQLDTDFNSGKYYFFMVKMQRVNQVLLFRAWFLNVRFLRSSLCFPDNIVYLFFFNLDFQSSKWADSLSPQITGDFMKVFLILFLCYLELPHILPSRTFNKYLFGFWMKSTFSFAPIFISQHWHSACLKVIIPPFKLFPNVLRVTFSFSRVYWKVSNVLQTSVLPCFGFPWLKANSSLCSMCFTSPCLHTPCDLFPSSCHRPLLSITILLWLPHHAMFKCQKQHQQLIVVSHLVYF